MPLQVVLYQPDIPQNAGNIARTCAATGAALHLVHPLGFYLSDRHLKRAGLDYWHLVQVHEHSSWEALLAAYPGARFWLTTGKGRQLYTEVTYQPGDMLVFGSEARGLPEALLSAYPESTVRIPMRHGARSLNVSNAAAIMVYEALRQLRPAFWDQ